METMNDDITTLLTRKERKASPAQEAGSGQVPPARRRGAGRPANGTVTRVSKTYTLDVEIIDAVERIAKANSMNINEVIEASLKNSINSYIRKFGKIPPRRSRIDMEDIFSD